MNNKSALANLQQDLANSFFGNGSGQRAEGYFPGLGQTDWEYLPPHLRPYITTSYSPFSSSTLPRNNYGQVRYSERCRYCTQHEVTEEVCDVCNSVYTYTVAHISVGASHWIDTQSHWCHESGKFLNLLLSAIIN